MNDFFYEPVTKKLIERLDLRFADSNVNPMKYEYISLSGNGEFLELMRGGKYLDENNELKDNTVVRQFRANDMTGVYVEY